MSVLIFLLIPVVIITVGCLALWFRARKPNTLHSGIDSFQREMKALSPEERQARHSRGGPSAGNR